MRWVLSLQPYRFRIVAIKGSQNIGADYTFFNTVVSYYGLPVESVNIKLQFTFT